MIPCYGIRLVTESHVMYDSKRIDGAATVCELMQAIGLHEKACEEFHSVYLNTKLEIIGMELISKGTLNASLVHPREVFKGAMLANANGLILVHNHPSGNLDPSSADRQVTSNLQEAGKILQIEILDHVIVGSKGGHYSFREQGLL